ncbi:kinesin-like protein [Trypanosoma cruzi]|uniref:Kinesin-like protein n=1 Tax=Trypanosoma cruzi TaxID=5693 RepID=A0A7J6YCD5_TRYCR|nr:kinesin-like protein [Trypanosoma cruzi]
MSHRPDSTGGGEDRGGAAAPSRTGVGIRQRETAGWDHTPISNVVSLQSAIQKEGLTEKIFFVVLDVTDGRRYKVFLRPDDISRLKVSKIRKTLSSASGKPPFSFALWLEDEPLIDKEDVNCAALGITPRTVMRMFPTKEEMPHPIGGSEGNGGVDRKREARKTLDNRKGSVSRVDKFMGQILDDPVETPRLVELNQRQRELQFQLYKEAKRCHIFSKDDAVAGIGKHRDDENDDALDALLSPPRTGKKSQICSASSARLPGEPICEDDSLMGFIEEILNEGPKRQCSPRPTPPSVECCPAMPDERQSCAAAAAAAKQPSLTPIRSNNKISASEIISHGMRLNEMYSLEDTGEFVEPPRFLNRDASSERKNSGDNDKEKNDVLPIKFGAATAVPIATQGEETEVTRLVEDLRDDVNNLLALHVRNETAKRALQRELSSSQQLVRHLEKKEAVARQQLDALLLRLRHAQEANGIQGFSEEEVRVALRNMAALRQNELLQRENAALEQRLAEEVRRRREMVLALEDMKGHIRVLVRVRPPFRLLHEQYVGMEGNNPMSVRDTVDESRMTADERRNTITITDSRGESKQFSFYRVFSESSTQAEVFVEVSPLVQLACDGVNVSVLAYGQTGSGKTYTILGGDGDQSNTEAKGDEENKENDDDGIVPRSLRMLFQHLQVEAATEAVVMPREDDNCNDDERPSSTYEVSCSLLELYNDKVRDLLAPPQVIIPNFQLRKSNVSEQRGKTQVTPQCNLKIGSDGLTHVVGLTQHVVCDAGEALRTLREGASRRQVHATQQNCHSSRSHLIFTVYLTQKRRIPFRNEASTTRASSTVLRRMESKLVFVDLAGSERISKSQSVGDRLLEARHINKSLAALGDVVATLSNATISNTAAVHVPYRNSTLTGLLQDVIGNRSKTVLLACVGPNDPPYENNTAETVTTLKFASRVRCVRNFAPLFPKTGATGDGDPTKVPGTNNLEPDVDPSHVSSSLGRGAKKLWMRPTKLSKQRTNIAARFRLVAANEAEKTEDGGRTRSPAPSWPPKGNNPHAEQRLRMRF